MNRVLIVALGWLLLVLPINIYKLAARGPILVLGDELVSRLSSQLQAIGSESEAIAEIRCPEKKNLRDGDSENCTVIRMNGEILTIRVTAHKSDSGARLVVSMVSVTAGPPWQYPSTTPTTSEPSAPYVAPQVTLVPSPYSDPGPVVVRPELVRQAGGAAACSEKVYKGLQAFLEPLISGGSGSQSDAEGEAARSAGGRDTAVYKLILQAYEQGLGRSLPADGESAYIAAYEVCGAPVPSESG